MASAHAEMGVREDGSAIGDGSRRAGIGSGEERRSDQFESFRARESGRYREQLAISHANRFEPRAH